jgi:hypothetical protein
VLALEQKEEEAEEGQEWLPWRILRKSQICKFGDSKKIKFLSCNENVAGKDGKLQ